MRKPFDDKTGKHTAKQPSLPSVDEIYEPITGVFDVSCSICEAKPGAPCTSIMGTHKERTYPHPARIDEARSKAHV